MIRLVSLVVREILAVVQSKPSQPVSPNGPRDPVVTVRRRASPRQDISCAVSAHSLTAVIWLASLLWTFVGDRSPPNKLKQANLELRRHLIGEGQS